MIQSSHHCHAVSAFWTVVISICLICGCSHSIDPRLKLAESIMEEHPDSALIILTDIDASKFSHPEDRALYGLLLAHARYKNFIDDTNDSLISASAEYFLNQDDKERSSRALFLKGIIQMNADRLGEAAVSFTKGLDIAKESKQYMWEGQCARGLFSVYYNLKNGSKQIKYAQAAYDAFSKGGYHDWKNYAKLNLLRSYYNHGELLHALKESEDLIGIAEKERDTLLMAETRTLIGACLYSTGDYVGCLNNYYNAYSLDSTVIPDNQNHLIGAAASHVSIDSLSDEMKSFISGIAIRSNLRKESIPAFKELAKQGKFEDAYYGLERYKNMQDSVLKVILCNNVSESVGQYESLKSIIRQKELIIERIRWILALLVLSIVVIISTMIYKKRLYQRKLELLHHQETIEMLRTDLATQINHIDEISADKKKMMDQNKNIAFRLREMLYDKYRSIDEICDSYFQDRTIQSKNNKLEKQVESLLKDFSNQDFLRDIGHHIDWCLDGLYSSFINDFPNLNYDSKRLFMFLVLGLSTRTICVIFDVETSIFYNRKSRLKKLVYESSVIRKDEYLKNIV